MNPIVGWGLAVVAIAFGYARYGWQGALFAITFVVFWLLLNFTRMMRVLSRAGKAPVGHVGSAVMLHSKLRPGMRVLDIISMTRSLGQRVSELPEVWRWTDDGRSSVEVTIENGRVSRWILHRPAGEVDEGGEGAP
ncbi:MAG TPA: hypothetical protein VFP68_00710 [Burkholderiaceae bacterium]|nr:hypothetical protein [Burkholderiaceae bacterium]